MPIFRTVLVGVLVVSPLLAQTPNTLVLVADDVGVDAISSYGLGSNPAPTPNINLLAATGIRFANAQSCPLCSPTRASILTGRHSFRTGVGVALPNNAPGLDGSEVLLPEILAPAGIQTAMIGKWHLGNDLGPLTPTAEGFGTFTGTIGGVVPSYYQWPKVTNGTVQQSTAYVTRDTVDDALAYVQAATQPWFLMVTFHAGHEPYEAPPSALHTQTLAGLNPQTTPIPFFHAMVQAMDTEIGRLLQGLTPGTFANTNIVFLGDNGSSSEVTESPFDPQRAKGSIYQGGIHVPLIVKGPAVVGGPRVEPALVHVVDLFATLAAMQGVDAAASVPGSVELDSISAMPLLAAPGQPAPRTFSYSQFFAGSTAMTTPDDTEMMRDSQFEVLRFVRQNGTIREEMYDLVVDPWETNDLLLQPLSPTAAAAYRTLRRELAKLRGLAWSASYGTGCSGAGVNPVFNVVPSTSPTIGTTFTLRMPITSPAVLLTVGAIGFQNTTWGGLPLPFDLGVIGMTGCMLWTDLAITSVLAQTAVAATMPVVLPNDPASIGTPLYMQAFPLVTGANPAGILATNAIEVIVGG